MDRFRNEFDPETLKILTRSFDLVWRYLQRELVCATIEDRDRLAELVFQIGKDGERKTIRVANLAIEKFRAGADHRFGAALTNPRRSRPADQSSIQLQGGA